MNPKHLATSFSINAILDKSAPERKTILDKMVDEKKETERLLEKLQEFAPQERLDRLTDQLQVLDAKIEQVLNTLPSLQARNILAQLGDVFDTQFNPIPRSPQVNTSFAVVTAQGIESLLGEEQILRVVNDLDNDSPNTNKTYDEYSSSNQTGLIINGYLVNLDLYQQVALLLAIEKKTGIKNKLGFYNFDGGACVHKATTRQLLNKKQTSWFWTAEKYLEASTATKYRNAGMVYLNDKELLVGLKKKSHFCNRSAWDGVWGHNVPGYYLINGLFVLGVILE